MELLKLIQERQSEEYKYNKRKESLKGLLGFNLTDFQLDVLMARCVDNSQTIYAKQPRQGGTTTALLLKLYQSIFLDNKLNDKYVISRNNNTSTHTKDQMMYLLGQANLLDVIRRHSRYKIEFNTGVTIHFDNSNANNLIGISRNNEFFIDNCNVNDNLLINAILVTSPSHIHIFQ